jgi:hypothetical protein
LDQENSSNNILEKAFFCFSGFFLGIWSFVSKKLKMVLLSGEFFFLEIGQVGRKKIENFK